MNTGLLELFLDYCERGISISFKSKTIEVPIKIINKFNFLSKNNNFIIFNELEENETFIINNLNQYKVKEYNDYIEIHNKDEEIIIEELAF